MGKGWYATLLSSFIDEKVVIPSYILRAIVFASQKVVDKKILRKIALHVSSVRKDDDIIEMIHNAKTDAEINTIVYKFCEKYPSDNFTSFIRFRKDLGFDG